MRKKFINRVLETTKTYSSKELKDHIKNDVDNESFNRHCQEVADNLKINVVIVKELLLDNAYQTLWLLQKSVTKKKEVKINIFGFFSFQTNFNNKKF